MKALDSLVAFALRLWEIREVRAAVHGFLFLSSASGAFWLLSRLLGWAALGLHSLLDESFAALFAILYNIVLAILFSSVMFVASVAGRRGWPALWHEFLGFAFVYLMLGAMYTDPSTGQINDYGIAGYGLGLGSYAAYAVRPALLLNPLTVGVYPVVHWIAHGWIGRLMSAYAVFKVVSYAFHLGLRGLAFLSRPLTWLRIRARENKHA